MANEGGLAGYNSSSTGYAPNQTPVPTQPNNNISQGSASQDAPPTNPTSGTQNSGTPLSGLDSWTPNYLEFGGGKNSYSDAMAAITRAEYDDYLKRFAPTEEKLIELATSGELYDLQQARNEELAANNLAQAQESAANSGAKYGLTDRRTDAQKNSLELGNALSLASMNNESRQALGDLQRNLVAGVSTSASQSMNRI